MKFRAVNVSRVFLARTWIYSAFIVTTIAAATFVYVHVVPPPNSMLLNELIGDPIYSSPCKGCGVLKSAQEQEVLQQQDFVTSVVWSPNEKFLEVGSLFEGQVNIYDTTDWRLVSHINGGAAGEGGFINLFTNDSEHLIRPKFTNLPNSENISLQKWSIESNSVVESFLSIFQDEHGFPNIMESHNSYPRTVAISATGDLVAAAVVGNEDGHVLVYDSKRNSILKDITCDYRHVPDAIAFSPNNDEIVVGGCHKGGYVSAFDLATGRMKFDVVADKYSDLYGLIAFSPDGRLIAVASEDAFEFGKVTILRTEDGLVLGVLPKNHVVVVPQDHYRGEDARVTNLQWINNNLILASYDDLNPDGSIARIWNVRSLALEGSYSGRYLHLALASLSPDGSRFAAVFGNIVVIESLK